MASTAEQRDAMAAFRELVGRLRVQADVEGWPLVLGRYGQIEWFTGHTLAVFTDRPRIATKLGILPGVRSHQLGDDEFRFVFPPAGLSAVARLVGARRRRVLDPRTTRNLAAGAATRFTSRPADGGRRPAPPIADQSGRLGA